MKWRVILILALLFSVVGSQAYAVPNGTYAFYGWVQIQSVFATNPPNGQVGPTSNKASFCIEGLEVTGDPSGIQYVAGSSDGGIDYGVEIAPLTMVIQQILLYPTGQVTGLIDNAGYTEPATVKTWGKSFPLFGLPCYWETEVIEPVGPAGTVVLNIPLDSSALVAPPDWFALFGLSYGDPSATSLTALAEFYSEPTPFTPQRIGAPLNANGPELLTIVSPDIHFEDEHLVVSDTMSFTTFSGTFTQEGCPLPGEPWAVSTTGVSDKTSVVSNYLFIGLIPALVIAGVLLRRRKK